MKKGWGANIKKSSFFSLRMHFPLSCFPLSLVERERSRESLTQERGAPAGVACGRELLFITIIYNILLYNNK